MKCKKAVFDFDLRMLFPPGDIFSFRIYEIDSSKYSKYSSLVSKEMVRLNPTASFETFELRMSKMLLIRLIKFTVPSLFSNSLTPFFHKNSIALATLSLNVSAAILTDIRFFSHCMCAFVILLPKFMLCSRWYFSKSTT